MLPLSTPPSPRRAARRDASDGDQMLLSLLDLLGCARRRHAALGHGVEGRGSRDWHFLGLKCIKRRGRRGSGHHAGAQPPPHRGKGTGEGPIWDPAHLAIPPVAASSVRSLFLLPAKSRSGEKRVKSGPHGMPLVPPGAPFARDGGGGGLQVREVLQEFLHPRGIRIHADPLQAF